LSDNVIDLTNCVWLIDLFFFDIYFRIVKLRNLWIIFNINKLIKIEKYE